MIEFSKYQATGNDFILIDARKGMSSNLDASKIKSLCDRRFGIGADGLIVLKNAAGYDFEMVNYNADGNLCSMCGNGARAITQFAFDSGIKSSRNKNQYHFLAVDGPHESILELKSSEIENSVPQIKVKMQNVSEIKTSPWGLHLNTGSPHLIIPLGKNPNQHTKLADYDVVSEGRKIRHDPYFSPQGINVNFIQSESNTHSIRTFERGVEDETLSCGTGVIAASLTQPLGLGTHEISFQTRGGLLSVQFTKISPHQFQDIWLIGPAIKVFSGSLTQKSLI